MVRPPRDLLPLFQARLAGLEPGWRELKFLVACSGGLDSTALLRLLALSLPPDHLAAAHLNHGLRGPAADGDQAFAARTAGELGLAFITEKRDVAGLARDRKKGLEEAARQARYEFLGRAAGRWAADFILTAHQADDQAETMLMNFLKGAGAGGLAGIPPRRPLRGGPEVLRPLLAFSREELRAWLAERNQPWREDASNRDGRFLRNALRHDLLPRLKLLNPRLPAALGRSAEVLRAEEDFWRDRLAGLWPRVVAGEGPAAIELNLGQLTARSLAERRRLVYAALVKIQRAQNLINEPIAFATLETALELAAAGDRRGLALPGGLWAAARGGALRLSAASRLMSRLD